MSFEEYLKVTQRIGFTESFPVKEVLEEIQLQRKCRDFDVIVTVQKVKLSFGSNENSVVTGIVTNRVSISNKLPVGGFGSHCYFDEATCMEEAIVEACKKWDMSIYHKVCSWPFAKVTAQSNQISKNVISDSYKIDSYKSLT